MSTTKIVLSVIGVVGLGVAVYLFAPPSVPDLPLPTGPEAIAKGEYLFNAGGCGACHQPEGTTAPIGGYEIKTEKPFLNIFRAPNITPDATGIAGWTGKDFIRALKHGRKPNGGFYWPAFPFRSYKGMTDEDVLLIGAYLMSLPPVSNKVPGHTLPVWQTSLMMAGWNKMADFMEGTPPKIESDDPLIQRGAYLARVLGHCGECHTPRNQLGIMLLSKEFEGSEIVHKSIDANTIAAWSSLEFTSFLELGMTKANDFVGGEMEDVIKHTKLLSKEDKEAYAAFFTRVSGGKGDGTVDSFD